ncbi:GNAT family N-acetyltransferase [Cohnella herbarum]|uniref:GNAT family N-acetyltransferase n=1 Tax=Cohnella herbarum TaxID=2728023 RepID=A0A7Z2VMB6_9BACL|nr:GNAT family N-acetyltransferase [Cohnella herbarum]QJD85559.1 GNAT family N-acetyltransferase [Cohnella herbarum]
MSHSFTIELEFVRLRTFTELDYEELYDLTRQTEITDLLPDWNMTEEQLEGFLGFVIGSYDTFDPSDVRILLAMEHKRDKRLIGWCGVFPNDLLDPIAREIAYAISKDYRNQGHITAAVRAMASFVFRHTQLEQIVAIVKPHNHASRRVVEKAGFRHLDLVRLSDQQDYDYFEYPKTGSDESEIDNRLLVRKARPEDAETLADIMKRTFNREINIWHQAEGPPDNNLCPPGYDSVEMHKYAIRESHYYVIVYERRTIGGICINSTGKRHARIDKLFIDPSYQGQGFGSKVVSLIEKAFATVEEWRLETSSKQVHNHRFYEKAGFVRTYESEREYGYEKIIPRVKDAIGIKHIEGEASRMENRNFSDTEFENCFMKGVDFYKINLEDGRYTNSNLQNSQFTDCNLSGSKFTNLNLTHVLLADLRLSGSEIGLVSLDGVYFHDTNLGADKKPILFERCDLSGSELRGCNLTNVNIRQCDLSGMKINDIPADELLSAYYKAVK